MHGERKPAESGGDALRGATELWQHIFGDERGSLAICHARVAGTKFGTRYFDYPSDAVSAAQWALNRSRRGEEVYFCAHLLTEATRIKENASGVYALWGDLDGAPIPNGELRPTAVVESSPGRYHCYWRLVDSIPPQSAETLNRRMALKIGADPSGFDLTQLLRVPGTVNHKYEDRPTVKVVRTNEDGTTYTAGDLDRMLPEEEFSDLGSADTVEAEIADGSRNETLTSIAGTLRRRGLDAEDIFAALTGINARKCKPPLPEVEVAQIAHSVARYEPGEDVSFYLHHTQMEFGANKPEDDKPLPIKTVEEVIEEAGEEVPWVIEDLLARGAVTEFSGKAKDSGKTTFWCHAIAAGARGEDHAGFSATPARYLYLTEQGNNFALALRDSGLTDHPDHVRVLQFKDVTAVQFDCLLRKAAKEANRLKMDALVVDTFAVFARLKGSEENDSGPVADRMRVLREVAQKYELAVLLIRHAGKDGTPRGSSAFEAEADICVTLGKPEGRHDPRVRYIAGKGRYGVWERNVQLHEGRFISLGNDAKVEFNRAVRFLRAVLPDTEAEGMKRQDILAKRQGADAEEITATTLDRALTWLVKQESVSKAKLTNERGQPVVYCLNPYEGVYLHQTPSVYETNKETPQDDIKTPTVAELFANPTDMLNDHITNYRRNPTAHFRSLCSYGAAVVIEDGADWRDVEDEVRSFVSQNVIDIDTGEHYDLYIGRGKRGSGLKKSKWHNPYVVDKDGTREECIKWFERDFLAGNLSVGIEDLTEVSGKILGCHCAPKACHGHVLVRLAKEYVEDF